MLSLALALSTAALLQFPDALQRSVFVVKDVRVEAPGVAARDGMTVLVRDGRIEAIGPDVATPIDADVVEGKGLTIVPGFVDAWTARLAPDATPAAGSGGRPGGASPPRPDRGPPASATAVDEGVATVAMDALARPGVEPATRAADSIAFDAEKSKAWRETGFGMVLAAPNGPMISGKSSLVALLDQWSPDALVKDDVALHLSLRAPPDGNYPSTLMGVMATLRQTFIDARLHDDRWKRFDANGGAGRRPALDQRLTALGPARRGEQPVVFEADSALDITAALDLAKELNVRPIIAGGAEAFRVADRLRGDGVPVIVALDFPDPPKGLKKPDPQPASAPATELPRASEAANPNSANPAPPADESPAGPRGARGRRGVDGPDPALAVTDPPSDAKSDEPTLPKRVLEEQDLRRNERIANAKVLAAKGVRFAFSSRGVKSLQQFKENLALAIEAGLDRERALRALTTDAAAILGASDRAGALDAGRTATFAAFEGDPFGKDSRVRLMVVDGRRFTFKPAPKKPEGKGGDGKGEPAPETAGNAAGTWQVELDSGGEKREYTVEITQDGSTLSGDARSARGTGEITAGSVSGTSTSFTVVFQFGARRYEFQYEGEISGDTMSGTCTVKSPEGGVGEPRPFTATRTPQPHSDVDEADEGDEP